MTKRSFSLLMISLLALNAAPMVWASHALAEEAASPAAKEGGDSKRKGSDDVSGGRFAGDPIYVHISPMVLPVINNNGVEQLVTIILDVEVKDFDSADAMHTHMPKVQDSLMRALY